MSNDDIAQYLDSLSREDRYRTDSVLKSSDFEQTEVVFLRSQDGCETGPFIRKTIKRDAGMGEVYKRIYAEQKSGKALPHIPTIYECYASESALIVIMEYVRGETIQDHVYRNDPSIELAEHVFPLVCDAVSELHESFDPPVIHRDLKPSNVMIEHDRARIIDFGIARDFKDQARSDTTHFGTRAYAPPEQFGYGQTSVRSDIYALGMLLYFCLTEQTPEARTAELGFNSPKVTDALRPVLVKACAFDPQARYETVQELRSAFLAALGANGSTAATETATNQTPTFDAAPATQPAQTAFLRHEPWSPQTQNGAVPEPAAMPTASPYRKPPSVIGIIYNVAIALFAALVIAASFFNIAHPTEANQDNPAWFNAFGFAFVVPALVLGAALVLCYKRPLKERFPFFAKLKWWHYLVGYAVLFTFVFFLTGAVAYVGGVR